MLKDNRWKGLAFFVYRSIIRPSFAFEWVPYPGGGGGVLGLEKGTDCGPSAAELWLSRANNAKKGGLSSHYR